MLLDSQSRPSYKPSPEVAQVLWMYLLARTACQLRGARAGRRGQPAALSLTRATRRGRRHKGSGKAQRTNAGSGERTRRHPRRARLPAKP